MTVTPSIDPVRLLEEQLAQASPDLLRELLGTFVNTLLSADADAVCGAEYGQVSPGRVNRRNSYRHRDFDARAGTIDVAIPKLRQGSYLRGRREPGWAGFGTKRSQELLGLLLEPVLDHPSCSHQGGNTEGPNTQLPPG